MLVRDIKGLFPLPLVCEREIGLRCLSLSKTLSSVVWTGELNVRFVIVTRSSLVEYSDSSGDGSREIVRQR